jgi:hypothetical protein
MKKLFFLFFLPLWGLGGSAHASVTVTPLSTDFINKNVTFRVEYANAVNNRAWVWIDLCPVSGVTPTTFQTAVISAASATGNNVIYSSTNTRGFFVTASPATVTATLSNASGKFNWCAYGSDAPPTAVINTGGGYTLKGTPPFTINGTLTENANTFGAGTCITSITDLTGNPDGNPHAIPQATITGAASNTCPAVTVVLTAAAANAATFTWYKNGSQVQSGASSQYTVEATGTYTVQGVHANCTGTTSTGKPITVNACGNVPGCGTLALYQTSSPNDGNDTWINAYNTCNSYGARLPYRDELICMCAIKNAIPGGFTPSWYWARELYDVSEGISYYYIYAFNPPLNCMENASNAKAYFRCVK